MDQNTKHLVITIHGIRTFGQWQERLERLVPREAGIRFAHYRFGYFSILAFLVPLVRMLVVRRFRREVETLSTRLKPNRIDLVGHSFGTHILGWSIRKLDPSIPIHTVILAGSVLKSEFYWADLFQGRIKRLINDCGTNDTALLFSQFFVLGTGMAGRAGFIGMNGPELRNRFSDFGHGGYFSDKAGKFSDEYMQRNWVPLLLGDGPIPEFDVRRAPTAVDGLRIFLTNNFEMFKIAGYLLLPTILLVWVSAQYILANAGQQRARAVSTLINSYKSKLFDFGDKMRTEIIMRDLSGIKNAISVPFRETSILWIDRNPGNNSVERKALQEFGLCFKLVNETSEGLEELKKHPSRYSMILTNFADPPTDGKSRLPIMDGLSAINLQLPIVIYSLNFTEEQAREALKNGTPEVWSPFELYNEIFNALKPDKSPVSNIELIAQSLLPCRANWYDKLPGMAG